MIATPDNLPALDAANFLHAQGSIVESAQQLAAAVIHELSRRDVVIVTLQNLRGLSSSYFDTLLLAIAQAHGAGALRERVRLTFTSEVQRATFQRSLDAVLREVGKHV